MSLQVDRPSEELDFNLGGVAPGASVLTAFSCLEALASGDLGTVSDASPRVSQVLETASLPFTCRLTNQSPHCKLRLSGLHTRRHQPPSLLTQNQGLDKKTQPQWASRWIPSLLTCLAWPSSGNPIKALSWPHPRASPDTLSSREPSGCRPCRAFAGN